MIISFHKPSYGKIYKIEYIKYLNLKNNWIYKIRFSKGKAKLCNGGEKYLNFSPKSYFIYSLGPYNFQTPVFDSY